MAWFYLILAGLSEIVWAFGIKESQGFSVLTWSLFTVFFLIISFYLLALSIRKISIGTAYAVFTGIGAAGTAIIGMMHFGETVGFGKIFSLVLLISGIIGLKLVDADSNSSERKEDN